MSTGDGVEDAANPTEGAEETLRSGKAGALGGSKIIALVIIAAVLVGVPLGYLALQSDSDGEIAVTMNGNGNTMELSIADLRDMTTYSGSGYLMKSTGTIVGPGSFTGVPLKSLVDLVYEASNYSLTVVASDGYEMTYTSGQVENGTFPTYDLDGNLLGPEDLTVMLAFEEDGETLLADELKVVIVDDTTTHVTDGHFWTKMVASINVGKYVEEWTIQLSGIEEMSMDRQTFESLASCYYHTTYYNFSDEAGDCSFEGIPLWVLVSAVDGGDVDEGHYMFNDALAELGYTVVVKASDGYFANFTAEQVARNNSILVAYKLDGEPLEADDWPLRIVGDRLSGSQKVRMISSIALEGYAEATAWELDLVGLTEATLTEWDFIALYNCEEGAHLSYYNYTDDDGDHSYAGIPLWVLVGMVDGPESGHWQFNETLADLEYNVTIRATDDYNITLSIDAIEYNNSLIVALTFDGEPLTGDEYPLMLVGEDLPGSFRVKSIASIELVDLPE
ncbi:MAG: molybdopterin-dependent oxidoreductase [Methanobacteriota archaeon]|nr:MAG: molybdopterin-dependent oxidoreductase [Euryarchaeota archaeon]